MSLHNHWVASRVMWGQRRGKMSNFRASRSCIGFSSKKLGSFLDTLPRWEGKSPYLCSNTSTAHVQSVDHWRNSDQKHRWIATALLDIEKSIGKIKGYRHLPRLQEALKRSMEQRTSEKAKKAAWGIHGSRYTISTKKGIDSEEIHESNRPTVRIIALNLMCLIPLSF